MKRLLALLFAMCLLFQLAACSGAGTAEEEQGALQVVTTIFPPYDFVRQLAGDHVRLSMLIRPGTETHTYEPTPQDIIAIENCDLFICAGGESDTWVKGILEDLELQDVTVIYMLDCVEALEEEEVGGMTLHDHEHEHDHGEEEEEYDEHVWTSLKNDVEICGVISDALCRLDPQNASEYRINLEAYTEKLLELDAVFEETAATAPGNTIVFGDRFPLRYFTEAYGLSYQAAFPGCAESTEPNAATLAYLIEFVNSEKIPVVFINELSNGNVARAIGEETGAQVCTFYSCHTVSADDFENGVTFLEIMGRNVDVLKEALGNGVD